MLDTIYAIKRLLFTFDLNISIEYGIKFKWDWLRDSTIALGICCKPESLPLCYGLYDIMGFLFQISRIFFYICIEISFLPFASILYQRDCLIISPFLICLYAD